MCLAAEGSLFAGLSPAETKTAVPELTFESFFKVALEIFCHRTNGVRANLKLRSRSARGLDHNDEGATRNFINRPAENEGSCVCFDVYVTAK